MAKLIDVKKAIEADMARSEALLKVIGLVDDVAATEDALSLKQVTLDELCAKVLSMQASLASVEAGLAARKKAVEDEVTAERTRVQQDLAKQKADLEEVRQARYKEQGIREEEAKAFREQQAKWARDNEALIKNLRSDVQEAKAVLDADLASLRRQTEAERGKLAELRLEIKAVADWAVAQAQS